MTTSIRLSPEISKRLDWLAEKTGRTKASYLQLIIESGVSDMEDYYRAIDGLERLLKEERKILSASAPRKVVGVEE
jgi:RHH-type transcriptional regulator, rel operon repressor / antitoxin RelB